MIPVHLFGAKTWLPNSELTSKMPIASWSNFLSDLTRNEKVNLRRNVVKTWRIERFFSSG